MADAPWLGIVLTRLTASLHRPAEGDHRASAASTSGRSQVRAHPSARGHHIRARNTSKALLVSFATRFVAPEW